MKHIKSISVIAGFLIIGAALLHAQLQTVSTNDDGSLITNTPSFVVITNFTYSATLCITANQLDSIIQGIQSFGVGSNVPFTSSNLTSLILMQDGNGGFKVTVKLHQ